MTRIVTRASNSEAMSNPLYAALMNGTPFDCIGFGHEYYETDLRVIRFKITDGTYECLITNLSEEETGTGEFREVCHLRWNEEASFRDLKHTTGMLYFHSADRNLIRKEIYASLILHNYCRLIANNMPPAENEEWKWKYKSNFKLAVTNIRRYMNDEIDGKGLTLRIKKSPAPIRPGRSYGRNVRPQSSRTPVYYTSWQEQYTVRLP